MGRGEKVRANLVLLEIRLLHFSQGVFQVAEHELLDLVVVRGPHFLDSQADADALEHANETNLPRASCWTSEILPFETPGGSSWSPLGRSCALVCQWTWKRKWWFTSVNGTSVRPQKDLLRKSDDFDLTYLCRNGISNWKIDQKGKYQLINQSAVLCVHVDGHTHPVGGGKEGTEVIHLIWPQPACLLVCACVCASLCVLMASTRGVWWVFNWSILILQPFENRQMGDEVCLGRASDGVRGNESAGTICGYIKCLHLRFSEHQTWGYGTAGQTGWRTRLRSSSQSPVTQADNRKKLLLKTKS